jgi:hypothetical protein
MSLLAIATRAVDAIVFDLSDRRGFNDPWYGIDEEIQEEIKAAWRTIITQEIQKDDAVNLDALPQAHNTRVNYVGRNIFRIDGHPGLYMQKKPNPLGPNPEPVAARKCVGKGGASGMFYRVPKLEAELRQALKEEKEPQP